MSPDLAAALMMGNDEKVEQSKILEKVKEIILVASAQQLLHVV